MKWLADENFRNAIIRGILRRIPAFDIVRAQDDPQITGHDDLVMLGCATNEGRIVVTHDILTRIPPMREQVRLISTCAPIVLVPDSLVPDSLSVSEVIEDLLLLDECAYEADWAAGVLYLPLR